MPSTVSVAIVTIDDASASAMPKVPQVHSIVWMPLLLVDG